MFSGAPHAAHSIHIQRKQGNLTKSRKSRQEMFSREKKRRMKMAQIIESIPNISEGRRQDVIEACVDQIRTTPGLARC